MSLYDEIVIAKKKWRKCENQRHFFYINLHLRDGSEIEFSSC